MNCRCCDPQALTVDYCDLCAQMRREADQLKARITALKDDLHRLVEIHMLHHNALADARSAPIEDRIPSPPRKNLRKFLLGS